MMHHDTITGTSPERVIKSAISRVKVALISNSMTLVNSLLDKIEIETRLKFEGLNQCL